MILFDQSAPAMVCMDAQEPGCVRLAAADLMKDLAAVSGREGSLLPLCAAKENAIVIGVLGNPSVEAMLQSAGVRTESIRGKWEHYLGEVQNGRLYLIGSDARGAMWAIYECCRLILGIDPLYLFTDHAPRPRKRLALEDLKLMDGPQSYRFRGWFINDEDLIEGYCRQGVPEKDYDFHQDYAPLLSMIVETALRLKQNLLIPASHIDMDNPAHEALVKLVTDRGMFISMHHQEPVGVNQQRLDRWFAARGDATENINFVVHPDKYREIWRHFIRKWAKYPNVIWQLGLRGRGDRPVWYQNDQVPDSTEARGALISQALQEQWNIIEEETGTANFLSSTTLWMEGMPLYRAGALKFPLNTMVILSDFGPDQMWGDEYYDTPRLPGIAYGVYYHICFWGCGPHLVQGNRPEKILYNFGQAERFGDNIYTILNVSNIREHVFGIFAASQAAWHPVSAAGPLSRAWCETVFDLKDGTAAAELYQEYFNSFSHLDDSRIPGRMLLMDGMCKRVSLMLMRIINGEELQKADIQNKRLFDFQDTDSFIQFYESKTKAGIQRFEAVLKKMNAYLPQIPQERRNFFQSNLLLQAETILGLYRWTHFLAKAAQKRRLGKGIQADIQKAERALEAILTARKNCLVPRWQYWYAGDTLIHVPDMLLRTKSLLLHPMKNADIPGAKF